MLTQDSFRVFSAGTASLVGATLQISTGIRACFSTQSTFSTEYDLEPASPKAHASSRLRALRATPVPSFRLRQSVAESN